MEWEATDEQCTVEAYKRSRKRLSSLDLSTYSDDEKAHVNAMIANCEYVIKWLETGHRPGNMRGIERLAGYQREKLVDPLIMQSYYARNQGIYNCGGHSNVTEDDVSRINDALSVLSPRERECYIMAHGQCFSHSDIADMLGIDRRNVNTLIQRAHMKLSQRYYQITIAM